MTRRSERSIDPGTAGIVDAMPTIFTRIIDGDLPATFVWNDEQCVAFLSINPLKPGHTLVVPRAEIEHWIDCPPELRDHLFRVAHHIAEAIDAEWEPAKVGLMIAGLEVPHTHLHVTPIWAVHDLDFANAAASVERDELETVAARIRGRLEEVNAARE